MSKTDIKTEGWISFLPAFMRPYAILMRLDRPVGWWLLLLPGWWGIALALYDVSLGLSDVMFVASLFWIGAILMRGAGCIINDLWDRNLDQKVERTRIRPLASGQISIRQAVIFLIGLLLLSFVILLQLSMTAIILGLFSTLLIVAYPLMKRITFWPQAFLGITFNIGVLIGYAAMTNTISPAAILLYVAAIFWTIGYDTIYALQDKDDDALVGIKSTALLFGENVKKWLVLFYGLLAVLVIAVISSLSTNIIAPIFSLLPIAHLIWQVKALDMGVHDNALKLFRSNVTIGFLILLTLIIGLF